MTMKTATNQAIGVNGAVRKRQGAERPKLKTHRGRKSY